MSRPKSIESLLEGSASEIAPSVTDLSKQETDEPAVEQKPEPAKHAKAGPMADKVAATKSKRPGPVTPKPEGTAADHPDEQCATGQPIRVQISTSDGSEIAAALEEIRSNIPPAFQKNFNLGAFFKDVLQANDAAVASMIRNSLKGDAQ